MKYLFLISIIVSTFTNLSAQKHDNVWVLGYHGQNPHPLQNNMLIDFNLNPVDIIPLNLDSGLYFNKTNASICSKEGELLFYTNGIYVANANHEIIENGDSLNNYGITNLYRETALNIQQGCIIIPLPESDNLYYVFHEPIDFEANGLGYNYPKLFYSIVNASTNNGEGAVVEKDKSMITDTLASGKITACKHANGRDWWIFVPKESKTTNGIYKFFLTKDTLINLGLQNVQTQIYEEIPSLGNSIFTPDGKKYIQQDIRFNPWNVISIYNFDRCNGNLSLVEQFEINDTTFLYGGAAASPDSRYLYCVTNKIIYQFDLWASNIESTKTKVAEFDGFVGLFFESIFGTPQLAPDGTILIAAGVADTVMHLIRTPNQPGLGSHVAQHAIHLPKVNQKSIPNFPNYRLGPLDGSPCDTLGLNNHPLAGFTWWAEELEVTFSDNSYYRPESWAWDFGDFATITERNPLHSYASPGEYHVCLIVANEYAADTICHWVTVDTLLDSVSVAVIPEAIHNFVKVQPNPASGRVTVTLAVPLAAEGGGWRLYDMMGRKVAGTDIPKGETAVSVDLSKLAPGLYLWGLESEGRQVGNGKLIIAK